MVLSIIAAVSENNVIGRDGALPWHLSDDLRRFKRLTMDHAIVMGRKTYESIGRRLPGRRMIVLSRQADFQPPHVTVFASLEGALAALAAEDEVFVVGGAAVYEAALPRTDRLYLTRVHTEVTGDVFFPNWDPNEWQLVHRERREQDARNSHAFSFLLYERPVS